MESRVMLKICHPNFVRIRDVTTGVKGNIGTVREYMMGKSL